MKETFDDIARNDNIPLPAVKPSNVDQLVIDHHQISSGLEPLYDFQDSSTEEENDDGFEDELSDSHQEKMRYKIEQLNAQFAADPTPVESNRQRHVTFKENLVDIMDSNSPQHSPDLLGDEDINEKSLELIQMLSQKPLFTELSSPITNSNELKNFENDYSELESEPEYSPVNNDTEPVEILDLEKPELKETENDVNEDEDYKCKIGDENGNDGRIHETYDEVGHCSEEVSHAEKEADVNKLANDETDSTIETKMLLNENTDNGILDEITSTETCHDSNVEKVQSDKSYTEIENSDVNESNLSSSTCHKNIIDNIDYALQSNVSLNTDELPIQELACAEINQNSICLKGLEENETEDVDKVLELCNELEQNNDNIDYAVSENCASNFNNSDISTDEVIPDENSISEDNHENVEDTNYEEDKVLTAEQSSNEQIYSDSKPVIDTSAETKVAKPSTTSKLKSSSKLKYAKSMENQPNRKLPNYKGNPRSQYGLSKEECKDLMHVRKEKISQIKRKEKEEEESRIQKQEEARKAFTAWLSKKKMQAKNKKVTKVVSLKEVPTKEENRKEYGDAEEAFQSWLKKKEKQLSREEILKQLEEEEKALNQCRVSRREATKAFNKWLVKKQKDQNQLGRRVTPHGNYLSSLPLQTRHIEAFAQTFRAYLGNTM